MARRPRKSEAEVLVTGLGRLMPWWLCLGLALVAYLVLHALASRPLGPPVLGQGVMFLVGPVWRGMATLGQYVLPILLVAAAGVSAFGRYSRNRLVARATGSNAAEAISAMSWQQFEQLLGQAFRLQGYRVTETGGGGADGGIDLILKRGTETSLVQAKHWKATQVGVDIVRSLYGLMAAHGAAGGFVVTSGGFTRDAIAFAEGRNVRLVDGPRLLQLIKAARAGGPEPAMDWPRVSEPKAVGSTPPVAPSCPDCSGPMVVRQAKRGPNAGGSFWGCVAFSTTGCRGTRPER